MTGRILGNYEVLDKLGEGGMGEVWRARDGRLNRTVAVKVLPSDLAGDSLRRQRFEQEARALAALNHPNIVAVYDIGQSEGQSYIVSELVDGESLRQVIEGGPLPVRRLLDLAVQTAEAIAAAQALGIVHRDLKPENIMVTRDSRVKVLDFGLAKQNSPASGDDAATMLLLSMQGMVMGTVGYMAPEQVRGEAVDGRSDIFSFGCVLYEMSTGRRAFEGQSAADVMSAILKEEPSELTASNAALPPALDAIVRRCLEKDPARRFQSAADLAFALRSITSVSSMHPATQVSGLVPAQAPARQLWVRPAVFGALAIALLAGGYLLRWFTTATEIPQFHRITFREGRVSGARFSPNGHDVVYAANWDGGPSAIYLATPGNPESRDLAIPNSRLLAVSSKGDLAVLKGKDTLTRNAIAGGQSRDLLEKVQLADWSPDSAEMAVVRTVNGIQHLEYPVGKVLLESKWGPFSMRVSPDGQRVAFTDYSDGSRIGLFVVDRAGKRQSLGAVSGQTTAVDAAPLAWSPDSTEIWYRSFDSTEGNTIYAMRLNGKRRTVARFPGPVRLYDVAAGRVLLSLENGRRGIRGMTPGDTVERDWSCLDTSFLKGLSSDGSIIVSDVVGESGGPKGSIYLRHTDGSPPVRLGDGSAFTLSPDGKWMAGYSSRDTADRKFILMPTGAGEVVDVKRKGIVLGWLADQNYLFASFSANGKVQLFSLDPRTDTVRALSPDGMPDIDIPMVSPDGRHFLTHSPDRQWYVYSIDGPDPRPVPGIRDPVNWTADGKAFYNILVNDSHVLSISRLEIESGKQTPWKEIRPIQSDRIDRFLMTPDGRTYAYNYATSRSELFVAEGIR